MGFLFGLILGFIGGVGCGLYYRRKIVSKARSLGAQVGRALDDGEPETQKPAQPTPISGAKYDPPRSS